DQHRYRHAGQSGDYWQDQPAAVAQVTKVELAPGLKAGNEEEQRHCAAIDPAAQVQGGRERADADRKFRCPELVVPRGSNVGPDQRQGDCRHEEPGAGRFRSQERASGLAETPRIDICGSCPWLVLVMSATSGTGDLFTLMMQSPLFTPLPCVLTLSLKPGML